MAAAVSTGRQGPGRGVEQQMVNALPDAPTESRSRVLVVDDEPGVVSFVARALRAKGFLVDVALGGEEALERMAVGRYDVVLLDLRMPDTNGVLVLKHVVAARPEQKVVVVSAAADTRIKVRCLELGAADFIAKPFELAELVARVGAHTRTAVSASALAVRSPRVIRVGALTLDLDRRTADAGAGAVALTGREFDLLRHLAERTPDACSREELLDAVWDTRFDPGTNVVDATVHRLRTKLASAAIRTVRNVGYRLDG
jgi:two-component system, OmpR family, response regulator